MKVLAREQKSDGSTGAMFPFRPNPEPSTRVAKEAYDAVRAVLEDLPQSDNVPGAVERMLRANGLLRNLPWPAPYDQTRHVLHLGDARSLSWVPDESVHLIVTSPPYWTLKEYEHSDEQLGDVEDYEAFLGELDKVWLECVRVLAPGGRICCVVGDVCVPRKRAGRHLVMPLHADIQVRSRRLGLDCLTPILWQKIANGVTEAKGNGAGFYGKPYQPGAIIKNDVEYILFMRKGGSYRSPNALQRVLSMLTKEEMQSWMRSSWSDIKGESTRGGHPAPYPVCLAERLIRMFSFVGDMVLDPFSGTGTTALAALLSGRNSTSNELEPSYHAIAEARLREAAWLPRACGSTLASITIR
jgi:site-specific DNA-methyltransferase (adenine-specific)